MKHLYSKEFMNFKITLQSVQILNEATLLISLGELQNNKPYCHYLPVRYDHDIVR